jgi:hypothetical protein
MPKQITCALGKDQVFDLYLAEDWHQAFPTLSGSRGRWDQARINREDFINKILGPLITPTLCSKLSKGGDSQNRYYVSQIKPQGSQYYIKLITVANEEKIIEVKLPDFRNREESISRLLKIAQTMINQISITDILDFPNDIAILAQLNPD